MAQLINGKEISAQIKEELKVEVAKLKADGKEITLAVIQVGADAASTFTWAIKRRRASTLVYVLWPMNWRRRQRRKN